MTESAPAGHREKPVGQAAVIELAPAPPPAEPGTGLSFELVYNDYFDFVWRSLLRLGIAEASADDAVQDVFVVVHRQLASFGGRSSLKTWLFSIALNVARDHRRSLRRKGGHEPLDEAHRDPSPGPHEYADRADTARLLNRALDALDDVKRAVFVLAELEGMTAPEIAEATGLNLNTVYSRLRVARELFQQAFLAAKGDQQ